MKNLTLFVAALLLLLPLQAQLLTPAPSPFTKIEQEVGLTDVTLEYSRPSMKERKIFGELVPFDEVWRTGANMNSTIQFSDDVTFGETPVKAGTYAIYTKPGTASWEVILYTDSQNGGTPEEWEEAKVAARVKAEVFTLPMDIQTFTISLDDLHNNGATLGILWEKTYVGVPFTVPTDKKATESIESVLAGPTAIDYFSAASYYHEEGKDLKKAKEWIDKAVAENGAFWILRRQSLIYAALGDKKGAIEAAKKSLALAEKENNQDYVKLNQDSLREWGAL